MAKNRRVSYRTGEVFSSNPRLPRPSDPSVYVFGQSVLTDTLPDPVARSRVSGSRIFGPPLKVKAAQGNARPYSYLESGLRIIAPRRVYFCVQRKKRKEVLFAKNIAGKRGIGRKGVRRTQNSQYRC